jgi:hypothetical protein
MASDWSYGSKVDLTNGGSNDLTAADIITSVSSSVVSIQIFVWMWSSNAANQEILLQLGDGGGYESTGYLSKANYTGTSTQRTDGFHHSPAAGSDAGDTASCWFDLWKYDNSSTIWYSRMHANEATKTSARAHAGWKSLSGNLDSIQITTPGGVATFDSGDAIARYK